MKGFVAKIHKQAGNTSNKVLLLLLGLLLVGFGAYAGINQRNNSAKQQPGAQPEVSVAPGKESPKVASPHTVVYGFWAGDNSIIKGYNLETKTSSVLAELPQNIKRITVKSPNTLYFISNTNRLDHGTEIAKATFGGKEQSFVKADDGFGIDDYYISPDGNYLTTWEVRLKPGENILYGGNSRVYSIAVSNPASKTLLYDEVADKPVHYPRGITNNGTVITDMFLPNSGPGWGYGMSTSDVTGTQKLDIPAMVNGTYGRQPRISQDGTMLSFAGYDGSKGSGTEQLDGIRKAVILPNTVEIVDAKTLQRKKLTNISNKYLYDDTRFDQDGKHLLISQIRYINKEYKPYVLVYDLEKNKATTVRGSKDKRGFALLSDSQLFVSTPNMTGQTLGNLGETYQFLNSDFGIINPQDGKLAVLPIKDSNMQFIGVFSNSEIAAGAGDADANRDALQLYSFSLKTNLLNDRINLQATSRANVSRTQNTRVQGIKTIAAVTTVAPIIPPGYQPDPGVTIPPGAVNPDGTPYDPNFNEQPEEDEQAPSQAPSQTVLSVAPSMALLSQAPEDVENPEAPEEGEEVEDPDQLDIPDGGAIPDDINGLIELIKQLLGILEEQAQN